MNRAASTIAIFAAVSYATIHASNHVTDFVLSRVGPFNVRFLFIYGTFTAFVITAGLLAWRPNRLPFALKSMALFFCLSALCSLRLPISHPRPSIRKSQPRFSIQYFMEATYFSPGTLGCRFWRRLPSGTFHNGECFI